MNKPTSQNPKSRPRIRAAAIILEDNRVLLARHEKDGKRYWVLPGGGVDFGETVEEALRRELKEETNLDIRVHDLVLLNDSIPPDRHRHIVNLYFTAEIVGGELSVGASDKRLVGAAFVPVEKLPRLRLFPDIRKELISGIHDGFPQGCGYLGNLWKDL